ncbi:hypothetical protein CONLIGDRAFT_665132 [Coniochaeta ligniaria NRRL 30616]|uniref:Uncharacterized protein n=1 Tax=Coniochaeta ligniaria NRRL 30616 TaxID=1408157 RepID=A0A1J7J4Q5_9PEZI|nr:hypothetical protein CONLIGDRAFT_665132 [Coniochaeta ligniaria NRRL 30616]
MSSDQDARKTKTKRRLKPHYFLKLSSLSENLTTMEALRGLLQRSHSSGHVKYSEVVVPMDSPGKIESYYQDRESEETQTPSLSSDGRPILYQIHPQQNIVFYKFTTALLAVALILLSTFHVLLLLNQPHAHDPFLPSTVTEQETTDCGTSVAEAKAKGCWWDELTKAWLPAECPEYGLPEYKMQGMMHNPHDNATSWPYYADQAGLSQVNFKVLAADEHRDPRATLWTTKRQHLNHCAWALKRVIWSYQNGQGQYPMISRMYHVNHCIDTLYRRATRGDGGGGDVDGLTTTARVHFGNCTFTKGAARPQHPL